MLPLTLPSPDGRGFRVADRDRKSTRLNSSHSQISYAVFCLKKKIPVTMLYGTPDDAAAQIAYIERRGYSIGYIEMGEEPDGKHAIPEDYAALYLQWARALQH